MTDFTLTTGRWDSEKGEFVETYDSISIPGVGGGGGSDDLNPAHSITTITAGADHDGITSQLFDVGNKIVIVWRRAPEHSVNTGGVLKVAESWDYGQTLTNERTLFDDSYDYAHVCGTDMGGGRLGFIATRYNGTSFESPLFVYSDDDGSTWSNTVLSSAPNITTPSFKMLEYPASVGGHDSDGYIVYSGYTSDGQGIDYLLTTDNGSTWSSGTAIAGQNGVWPSEPAISRIGDTDQWLMLIRRNESSGLNARAWTSTDMTTWNGPTDTGQMLGQNPHNLLYEDGQFHWVGFSRPESNNPIEAFGESVIVQSLSANTAFDAPDSWSGWSLAASGILQITGYWHPVKVDGAWMGTLCINEDATSNDRAQLGLMSSVSQPHIAGITDGDGTQRKIWVIPNGASDPTGAAPEDLIFEEQ